MVEGTNSPVRISLGGSFYLQNLSIGRASQEERKTIIHEGLVDEGIEPEDLRGSSPLPTAGSTVATGGPVFEIEVATRSRLRAGGGIRIAPSYAKVAAKEEEYSNGRSPEKGLEYATLRYLGAQRVNIGGIFGTVGINTEDTHLSLRAGIETAYIHREW
ncbi:MAG: hypothetical protein ABID35_05855, partial [Candidatus Margulisiibacteriota bacterium]